MFSVAINRLESHGFSDLVLLLTKLSSLVRGPIATCCVELVIDFKFRYLFFTPLILTSVPVLSAHDPGSAIKAGSILGGAGLGCFRAMNTIVGRPRRLLARVTGRCKWGWLPAMLNSMAEGWESGDRACRGSSRVVA